LRFAMAGSSVVPVELIRAFHRRGLPVGQIYGSTETGPVSIVLKREDAMRKEGACGVPALGCSVRIVDEAGRDVPAGQSGEVLIKAPNLMTGYWQDEAATRAAMNDGWYRTGDIGRLDPDGFYWVDERKKDMIISGGENIYPAELEAVLDGFKHPHAVVFVDALPRNVMGKVLRYRLREQFGSSSG
jgi:fatty-acyl-CoA synthase